MMLTVSGSESYELHHEKTNNLQTAKLISDFDFAIQIVQSLYFLNAKFQASSHLPCLYSSVCVKPVRKPHCWFSHEEACP